jgi:hypothetical protein
MTSFSESFNQPIVEAYDFSTFHELVDVGGAHGSLLRAILEVNSDLRGILFDLPPVVKSAQATFRGTDLEKRTVLVGGDLFQEIPPDADAYMLKFILHNWSDSKSFEILQNCRNAMRPDSRLLIVEQIIPAGNEPFFGKILDLEMLVVLAGKERTASEFKDLLDASGFKLTRIIPTQSPFSIIEALPELA